MKVNVNDLGVMVLTMLVEGLGEERVSNLLTDSEVRILVKDTIPATNRVLALNAKLGGLIMYNVGKSGVSCGKVMYTFNPFLSVEEYGVRLNRSVFPYILKYKLLD